MLGTINQINNCVGFGLTNSPTVARTANIGLAIWRPKCFYETFVQGSTLGILLNFCAKNSPHRQADRALVAILEQYNMTPTQEFNNK